MPSWPRQRKICSHSGHSLMRRCSLVVPLASPGASPEANPRENAAVMEVVRSSTQSPRPIQLDVRIRSSHRAGKRRNPLSSKSGSTRSRAIDRVTSAKAKKMMYMTLSQTTVVKATMTAACTKHQGHLESAVDDVLTSTIHLKRVGGNEATISPAVGLENAMPCSVGWWQWVRWYSTPMLTG